MARSYEEAARILYQASFAEFVAERKRLAAELKAAGDKDGALRLGKLTRPSLGAWAVNQLWWNAPEDFAALFAAARRMREGDLSGTEARREAIVALRERAATLLAEANRGASEATLRRVATTLAALAAAGSFAPDAPGQLAQDRDPPGFESAGLLDGAAAARPHAIARPSSPPRPRELEEARRQRELREAQRREDEAARARAEAEERRRAEAERARQRAERERLARSLRSLRSEIERRARDVERMRNELVQAQSELEKARASASQIEARLAASEEGS